jgi:hypothetical protein
MLRLAENRRTEPTRPGRKLQREAVKLPRVALDIVVARFGVTPFFGSYKPSWPAGT